MPEQLIYIVVWVVVFLVPVVDEGYTYLSGKADTLQWTPVWRAWLSVTPFLLLFVLHNRCLAPCLFSRRRVWWYVGITLLLTVLLMRIDFFPVSKPQPKSRAASEHFAKPQRPPRPAGDTLMPPPAREKPQPHGLSEQRPHKPRNARPPVPLGLPMPLLARIVLALLMLSFNIAVKLFFKSLRDKETLKELERQHLQSELEYLKYQINPHFFMNTLNNIHALVDIDTEKAKETIVELSRLMRYVLYESDKRTISLEKEVQFLRHYVELMRIRYPESVHILLSLPEGAEAIQIPPLLFISFVENAFKHGVSYQKESCISVVVKVEEDGILFQCTNTRFGKGEDQHHGIGLDNIRKRLQLLYGDRYVLDINATEEQFEVLLSIPKGK